jgi:hypothetical protein
MTLLSSAIIVVILLTLVHIANGRSFNRSSSTTEQHHDYGHYYQSLSSFEFHWSHVSAPLSISTWLAVVIIAKIGRYIRFTDLPNLNDILAFHTSKRLVTIFPDSALLIVLGLIFGGCLHFVWPHEIYLLPELFFLYLLPPIVLDAGYFMPIPAFFNNLITILVYAVVGTLWNVFAIGELIWILTLISNKCPDLSRW